MGFECTARTHVGLRRTLNEDALLNCTDRGLWAVADGMGGHEAGEVASAMVIDALAACGAQANGTVDATAAITALQETNQRLQDLAHASNEDRTIGSTVVGLIANASAYNCFWVGDSRGYRVREGALEQLTRDHSLVQELVDAGMLAAEEAESHPNANIITRAVGAEQTLRVDTVSGEVRSGDVFLLASDGLTRVLTEAELLSTLTAADLDAVANDLISLALERGGPDNISLVIVRAA